MRKKLAICILCIVLVITGFHSSTSSLAESTDQQTKVDYMMICAHPGDEYLYLGGVLPIYSGEQGLSAVVVYLSYKDEAQKAEAINGLKRYGNQVKAVFGSFTPVYLSTLEEAKRYWNKTEVITFLTDTIQAYNPTVIITHDQLGEYGHGAHCLTTECTLQVVRNCIEGDPDSDVVMPELKLKRLFLHLFAENQITLNRSLPLSHFKEKTALSLDQEGYQSYTETYPIEISDEAGYTQASYGLAYPIDDVTFDSANGDMFGGIDESLLSPTATPVPTPTSTPQPMPPPTETLRVSDAVDIDSGSHIAQFSQTVITILILVFLIGAFLFLVIIGIRIVKKRPGRKNLQVITFGIVFMAILFALYYLISVTQANRSTLAEESTSTPQVTPIQNPMNSSTPVVTATPTPTPDPWSAYFREESDPAEVVISDPQNEHWEYKSDQLSIIVDRIHVIRADQKPVCYCVAQIRMRGEDAFRAGLNVENATKTPYYEHPWLMARRCRAVLAITGDSLAFSEPEIKGILIRNGGIYSENQAQDMLAFYPNDLTMKIYKPNTITAQEFLDQGVINVYSFGPTLLNNGVRDLESKRGRLGIYNPRCGIGMVEPGYFIAITVDGRQDHYSYGVSLTEFAHLFYSYGCKVAYNLDGGSSTVMIFMGEHLNQHSGEGTDMQRPLADALMWGYSELVPTVDDPIYNNGRGTWRMPPETDQQD